MDGCKSGKVLGREEQALIIRLNNLSLNVNVQTLA